MVEQLRIEFPTDAEDEEWSERVFAPLLGTKHKAVSVRSSRR
jgi:hypothetical protein